MFISVKGMYNTVKSRQKNRHEAENAVAILQNMKGWKIMNKLIRFNQVEDILDFVSVTKDYPYHMDICYGNHTVDAKSIMGVMAIGLGRDVTLKAYTDDAMDLCKKIEKYAASRNGQLNVQTEDRGG